MSTSSLISLGVALLVGVFFVVSFGALSLLSGALHFLFAGPRLRFLKSSTGETGFAFSFKFDPSLEDAAFDTFKLRLINPFAVTDTQIDIVKSFSAQKGSFAQDLDLGADYLKIIAALANGKSSVLIEISDSKNGLLKAFDMKGNKFLKQLNSATTSFSEFTQKSSTAAASKPIFTIPKRNFIAAPLPQTGKVLKLATNPEFSGEFQANAASGDAAAEVANFAVSKVWIDDGCIVCDACESIYEAVFEVKESTCIIRPGAPLDNGLLIQEAAEACPVEVIKFNKA